MQTGRRPTGLRYMLRALLACALVIVCARTAAAHITLQRSSPAREEVVTTMPGELRLEFSGRIEERYTSVWLSAPDGGGVAIGRVVFENGSDRIITVQLPPLTGAGAYIVRWRTAGADGHVLEGSYSFTHAPDSTARDSAFVQSEMAPGPGHDHEHAPEHEARPVANTLDVVGRGLHFLALLLVTGAVVFRAALVPRLQLAHDSAVLLQRRAWQVLSAGALLLGAAAILRLWLQSSALHGADRAWNSTLLSIMLRDTSWGRAWVLQVMFFAVLGAAIAWARPARDRSATVLALLATLGLCAIPALSGHAAGASGAGWIIVVNDTAHVFAAGAWLGTLGLLLALALPHLMRDAPDGRAAAAVAAFSPLALAAAATVAISGIVNTVVHLTAVAQLWSTPYGRTLLIKLLFVAFTVLTGFVNWRVVQPRMTAPGGSARLRVSASLELVFALLVLTATSVLTGQPRP